MTYEALVDLTLARARRLRLASPETGQVDAGDVEVALINQLIDLVGRYDLAAFTVINRAMFQTTTDHIAYALPEDFSRFVTPRSIDEYGLALNDGTATLSPLLYREPMDFEQQRTTDARKPRYFTLAEGRQLLLDPPPDANGGTPYIGDGVYIRDINADTVTPDTEVPLTYVNMLQHAALAELASDAGHGSTSRLQAQAGQAVSAVVNREARQQLKYQRKHTQIGRRGRYRRL